MAPFFRVEGFSPTQILRKARNRVESAAAEKMAQMSQNCEDEYKAYQEYKVSNKVQKDEDVDKGLDNLDEQLKNSEFHTVRGAKKLAGTKTIFYMRSGNTDRLFFRDSETEKRALEVGAESNKKEKENIIKNIKKNYK
jgi:hypothetical protein